MEYHSKTLKQWIGDGGYTVKDAMLVFYFIIRGITQAHTNNQIITHRDIKPSNILFNERMCPLIADWGLASKDS